MGVEKVVKVLIAKSNLTNLISEENEGNIIEVLQGYDAKGEYIYKIKEDISSDELVDTYLSLSELEKKIEEKINFRPVLSELKLDISNKARIKSDILTLALIKGYRIKLFLDREDELKNKYLEPRANQFDKEINKIFNYDNEDIVSLFNLVKEEKFKKDREKELIGKVKKEFHKKPIDLVAGYKTIVDLSLMSDENLHNLAEKTIEDAEKSRSFSKPYKPASKYIKTDKEESTEHLYAGFKRIIKEYQELDNLSLDKLIKFVEKDSDFIDRLKKQIILQLLEEYDFGKKLVELYVENYNRNPIDLLKDIGKTEVLENLKGVYLELEKNHFYQDFYETVCSNYYCLLSLARLEKENKFGRLLLEKSSDFFGKFIKKEEYPPEVNIWEAITYYDFSKTYYNLFEYQVLDPKLAIDHTNVRNLQSDLNSSLKAFKAGIVKLRDKEEYDSKLFSMLKKYSAAFHNLLTDLEELVNLDHYYLSGRKYTGSSGWDFPDYGKVLKREFNPLFEKLDVLREINSELFKKSGLRKNIT